MSLCFVCFGSDCWAIRNAASQLFAALLTRVFGVPQNVQRSFHPHQKNRISSYEFFTRYA
ncbi:unnamed protein product [Gongylonema pulchrum]|uniref:Secreted protein n=1 Tax=Gongylonema pulchrum TaxID=637853 RepID=A0A183EDD8_9BILA|nr:unnamed protein product [Gongylonema pulchrum]